MAIALRAGFGQDEVSHGGERYRVGGDRLVFVPPPVAVHLIRNAGFYPVSTPDAEPVLAAVSGARPQSLLRVCHPTAVGCSYGGREYRRDQNAEFLVPAEAVADLIGHGFVPVPPAGEQQAERQGRLATQDDGLRGPDL